MKISYKKLWKLLIDKGMKKIDLLEKANIST
jgi:DNA-binding Xre family transcriptional regulator